ncbi:MAG: ATP-binding protein [Thermoleophilaceae bacterium]
MARPLDQTPGLSLGRSLRLALIGLTVVLGVVAALGVGGLYSARQDFEDALVRSYELEAASAQLLAAGVIEESTFGLRGEGAPAARASAVEAFDERARRALVLARGDPESVELVRRRIAAQRRARRVATLTRARGRPLRNAANRLSAAILSARSAAEDLVDRQRTLRADARDQARDDTRRALVTALIAGALALLGALLLVTGVIGSVRRPLQDLLAGTRRLAGGDLDQRVDPGGPRELRELGGAFNSMAEDLGGASARIEDERRKLAATIESLGDALVVTGADGEVTAANPRAAEFTPELAPGAHIGDDRLLPPLDDALGREVVIERGGRTLAVTAAPLDTAEGGSIWTIRDISERARLEQAKSDFVATASHELRSPLTSIKGFVELLSRSQGLEQRESEFVDIILRSTDRLVDLVGDLLDVTRIEAGEMDVHPRPFDLEQEVREVAELMTPRIEEKGQQLEVHAPSGLPQVLADPNRMRQVVTNLLSNAHQYTDEGGHLTISLAEREGGLELAVADDGRGMTAAERERAFDRFARRTPAGTGGDGGGTGLGLSIVKSLVELQDGTIEVISEPEKGSTLTVRLPTAPATGYDGRLRRVLRGKRVLVVDDEPDVAALIGAQLEPLEVSIEAASNGDDAISMLRQDHFDAMTLDILMPGTSGLDVLRAIRADPDLNRTPVVVVSAFSSSRALFGEWKVTKPIEAGALADSLGSAMLAGRTRVLVVGRASLRERLEPSLAELRLDHEWATSAAAAERACAAQRFEIALVDAGLRSPAAAVRALDLRGRRVRRAVVLFSAGDEVSGVAELGAEPVPIEAAAGAVLDALAEGSGENTSSTPPGAGGTGPGAGD